MTTGYIGESTKKLMETRVNSMKKASIFVLKLTIMRDGIKWDSYEIVIERDSIILTQVVHNAAHISCFATRKTCKFIPSTGEGKMWQLL